MVTITVSTDIVTHVFVQTFGLGRDFLGINPEIWAFAAVRVLIG